MLLYVYRWDVLCKYICTIVRKGDNKLMFFFLNQSQIEIGKKLMQYVFSMKNIIVKFVQALLILKLLKYY